MTNFNIQSIRHSHVVFDDRYKIQCFHANDPYAMVQITGYLKSELKNKGRVYFRGQRKIYGNNLLIPSAYRNLKTNGAMHKVNERLKNIVSAYRAQCSIFSKRKINDETIEAVLQHYGYNTSWIDIVDNAWVALWFACHRYVIDNSLKSIGHWVLRAAGKSEGKVVLYKRDKEGAILSRNGTDIMMCANDPIFDENEYAYIYLICVDENYEENDLRLNLPSVFIRPHMQHGLVFRSSRNKDDGLRKRDYSSSIVGVIRIYIKDAIKWLGNGDLTNKDHLFPPPFYDSGYNILLDSDQKVQDESGVKSMGSIQIVTSGP